jgi:chromate transporter
MILLELFWSFFQIGLFSFGGGYAALPLILKQVAEVHTWLTAAEFSDVVTISQMTPGPIALNAATFVGTKIMGLAGALTATLGFILPSMIIVLALAAFYARYRDLRMVKGVLRGLRPGVVGLIASAGLSMAILAFAAQPGEPAVYGVGLVSAGIFAAAFFALRKLKANPILVLACSGAVGFIAYSLL